MTKSRIQQSPVDEEDGDHLPVMQEESEEEEGQQGGDEGGREGTQNPMGSDDRYVDSEDLWDAKNKAIITEGELGILLHGQARWMGYKGSAKKEFFELMVEELRKLDEMKSLSGGDWERRIKAYAGWLSNHSRKESTHGRLKVGSTWTVRSVVQETHRNEIRQWIRQRNDVKLGSKVAIAMHQKELTEYLGDLSDEEINSAQQLANAWNLKDGPPDDVKAKCAEEKGGELMEEFAREMWRSCGMRMVIITGFKNRKGEVMTAIGDINDTFKEGSKFVEIDKIGEEWQEFVADQFSARGRAVTVDDRDSDDAGVPPEAGPVRREKKADAAKEVTQADGHILVPDITGKTRGELQCLVRGYVTAKYRLACGNPKVSAPFKKLPTMFRKMIHGQYVPPGFTFNGDPSHMQVEDARSFLQFIIDRQESDPSDTFQFSRWLNDEGKLQDAVEIDDGDEDENGVGVGKGTQGKQSDKRSRHRSSQVVSGKGKGKARHNQNDSDDEEESDAPENSYGPLNSVQKQPQKSRHHPSSAGPPELNDVPPPSNQLALTSRSKATFHLDRDAESTPRPRKGKAEEPRVRHKNSTHARTDDAEDDHSDRDGYNRDTDEEAGDVGRANRTIRRASAHNRTAILPKVITTPQNASYEDDNNDRNSEPAGGRRSTRSRKVPKPRDADFPTPSQKGGHKRKRSGHAKDVGRVVRATQRN